MHASAAEPSWEPPAIATTPLADGAFDHALTLSRLDLQRCARRLTADSAEVEDLVQETLLKALLWRRRFRPGSNLRAWLRCILRNHFLDQRRRPQTALIARPEIVAPDQEPPDGEVYDSFPIELVMSSIAALQANEREIIDLATFKRRPYREIATTLGIKPSTVGTRLLRARRKLRQKVHDQLGREADPPDLPGPTGSSAA
ncbi:MAG TPA: RNA polymerase sigma factor [Polyangia bacterium]